MNNPKPFCDKDCRFMYSGGSTTRMYFDPIYDKNGVNINPDGNITTSTVKCITCNTSWHAHTQYGKTTFTGTSKLNADFQKDYV